MPPPARWGTEGGKSACLHIQSNLTLTSLHFRVVCKCLSNLTYAESDLRLILIAQFGISDGEYWIHNNGLSRVLAAID